MTCDSSRLFCFVTFRLGPGTPTSQRQAAFQADSVMRRQGTIRRRAPLPSFTIFGTAPSFGHRALAFGWSTTAAIVTVVIRLVR